MTGNRGIINTPGIEFDHRLHVVTNSYFPKAYADAFSNKDLERYLVQQQVNTVFVCGLDAVHCVDATARGAANRGYRATVIEGAIATLSAQPMAAIIAGYRRHGVDAIPIEEFSKD